MSPTLDKDGRPVHVIDCSVCFGDGVVERCRYGHSGICPCSTVRVWCNACRAQGKVEVEGCDCSLCAQVWEDLRTREVLQ